MAVNWEQRLKDYIKKLEALKPEDRLQTVAALNECWSAVNGSQIGWARWITNVRLMSLLPEDLLKHLLDVFRKCAIAFLKFDIAATNAANPFIKVDEKERVEKGRSRDQSRIIS